MILRRLTANLKAQNWTAITIDFVIVVIGVFLGIQASNWNQARLEKRQTRQMLVQLKPELQGLEKISMSAHRYYAATGRYADTAFAGWAGDPRVTDEQFVIGAYQASQIYGGFNTNGASWALVFGANDLRNIDDRQIREPLTRLMTFDYGLLNLSAQTSRYREEVRRVIPDDIQQEVRAACGDRIQADGRSTALVVPCPLRLASARATAAAAELRRHPELVRLLRLHRTVAAAYLTTLDLFDGQEKLLMNRISELDR